MFQVLMAVTEDNSLLGCDSYSQADSVTFQKTVTFNYLSLTAPIQFQNYMFLHVYYWMHWGGGGVASD
jgi:hypothetical protein